ncbi:MAG: CBS domain-containing protein [Bryobacteraceae bacterium]|nr:CBS domain-containing protein [Bryobacterales bacterium]MEB2363456.1 CBS domain-containing protein [Bryobacterales bacterium]NUN02081.1 CBS domain-containing protein [Bryobacteraceae bacterium]
MAAKCKDFMTKDPVCCLGADSAEKAAQIMKREDIGSVPVVEDSQNKKLVGIVTDRDLALRIVAEGRDPKSARVSDVMSRGLVTCPADDDAQNAIDAMENHQIRRLPVVDAAGRIVGIITQADIARRLGKDQETGKMVGEISKPKRMGGGGGR